MHFVVKRNPCLNFHVKLEASAVLIGLIYIKFQLHCISSINQKHFAEFLSGAMNMTEPQVQQAMAKLTSEQLGVDIKT